MSLQLTDKKFGKLLVLKQFGRDRHQKVLWLCKCDCGIKHIARASDLVSGKIVSCGCYRKGVLKTHGYSGERLYSIWHNVIGRTKYPNSFYHDRGIKVIKRWLNYLNFRKDLIKSYEEHIKKFGELNTSIDRINPYGNYERKNVKWSTKKEQANNTRRNANVS